MEVLVRNEIDATVFELYDSNVGDVRLAIAALHDSGYVLSVDVLQAFRNRGYGEALMRALVEYVDMNGLGELSLDVDAGNRYTIRLYKSVGFKQVDRRDNFIEMVRPAKEG